MNFEFNQKSNYINNLSYDIIRNELFSYLSNNDKLNFIHTNKKFNLNFHNDVSKLIISRLSSLFPRGKDNFKEILKYVSDRGVIAGGSMVFALNTYISKDKVSDIDIYIPTKELFIEICQYLRSISLYDVLHRLNPTSYNSQILENESSENISIINVILNETSMQFQLILFEFNSAVDVIKTFDFDYVQCAFYQGSVYRSNDCIISHIRKQVTYGYHIPSFNRTNKAREKGFLCSSIGTISPFITKYRELRFENQTESHIINLLNYFKPKKNIFRFSFDSLQVTSFRKGIQKSTNPLFLTHKIDIHININEIDFITEFIDIPLCIEDVYDTYNSVKISPVRIMNVDFIFATAVNIPKPIRLGHFVATVLFSLSFDKRNNNARKITMKIMKLMDKTGTTTVISDNAVVDLE